MAIMAGPAFNHNKPRHRQTDGQTDDSIMPIADHIAAVRSADWAEK